MDKLLGNLLGRSSDSLRFLFLSVSISIGFKGDLLKGDLLVSELLHGDRNSALFAGLFSLSKENIPEVPRKEKEIKMWTTENNSTIKILITINNVLLLFFPIMLLEIREPYKYVLVFSNHILHP